MKRSKLVLFPLLTLLLSGCSFITNLLEDNDVSSDSYVDDPTYDDGEGPGGYPTSDDTLKKAEFMEFGMYPQSEVTDEGLASTLTSLAGTLPTVDNPSSWIDYKYHFDGNVETFMWYIDITHEGNVYRGIYFIKYRASMNGPGTGDVRLEYQPDNGYELETVYWFRFEPLKWAIVKKDDNKAMLFANVVLDAQEYHIQYDSKRTINLLDVYPSNYAHSDVRTWVNTVFFDTAFTISDKEKILTTEVDNTIASTGLDESNYLCENTFDKVFLPSISELQYIDYTFEPGSVLMVKPSDYTISQGIPTVSGENDENYVDWYTRTSDPISPSFQHNVATYNGYVGTMRTDTIGGIVPSLWINFP